MCHADYDMSHGRASDGGRGQRPSGETIARSGYKAILAGLFLALPLSMAHASERTAIMGYICATHESARQVALERAWERPGSMPGDCRTLLWRGFDERVADILEITEVITTGDGRWIEIAKVRRKLAEIGYSAGISEQLLLF